MLVTAAVLVIVVAAASGLAALRYEAQCTATPPYAGGAPTMKAVVHRCYGSPDVLAIPLTLENRRSTMHQLIS